jgi:S1-C subfamily serine protease
MSQLRKTRALAVWLAVFLCLASQSVLAAEDNPGRKVYRQTLNSTAWVHSGEATGTAWVVSRPHRLLVTNHHVVGNSDEVRVFFPMYEEGQVIADREEFARQGRAIKGQVLETDPWRDLAVIQVESLPATARAVALAPQSASPGDPVHSIGNSGKSGALWAYTEGKVKQVYREKLRTATGLHVRVRIMETQAPVNPGDSGGPVVNDEGQLVGVVCSYMVNARLVSQCIDVTEVKAFVEGVQAGLEVKKAWPAVPVVIQAAPLDVLLPQVKTLAKLVLPAEDRKEVNQSLKELTALAAKGAVDPKRPLGAYLTPDADADIESFDFNDIESGVLLIPVTDPAAFRTALAQAGSVKAEGEGVWVIRRGVDAPLYLRFAHDYAYLAVKDKALIDGDLIDPATVLSARNNRLVSVGVRLPSLNKKHWKDLEEAIKEAREEVKGDPRKLDAVGQLQWYATKEMLRWLEVFRADGDELWVHLETNPATEQYSAEVRLTGKRGSALANGIAEFGRNSSLFYDLGGQDPALRGLVCASLPEDVRKALVAVLDDVAPSAKGPATALKMLTSSLRQGKVDALYELHGPDSVQHFTLFAAARVTEGQKWLRELGGLRDPTIRLDAATVQLSAERAIPIHQLVFPEIPEDVKRLFGKASVHWFLIDSAFVGVMGEQSLKTIREIITEAARGEDIKHGPQVLIDLSLRRLIPTSEADKQLAKLIDDAIKPGTPDRLQITLEGGRALTLRVNVHPAALRALAAIIQADASDD